MPGANEPASAAAPASAASVAVAMTATRPLRSYSMPMTMRAAPFVVETRPTSRVAKPASSPTAKPGDFASPMIMSPAQMAHVARGQYTQNSGERAIEGASRRRTPSAATASSTLVRGFTMTVVANSTSATRRARPMKTTLHPVTSMQAAAAVPSTRPPMPNPIMRAPDEKPTRSGNHAFTVAMMVLYAMPHPVPHRMP